MDANDRTSSSSAAEQQPHEVPPSPSAPLHTIRLRGAWNTTAAPDGTARHTRNFGRPRTLDSNERLWLVCTMLPTGGEVYLNEERIAIVPAGPFAEDITTRLQTRNTVAFVVAEVSTPLGEVILEVRLIA